MDTCCICNMPFSILTDAQRKSSKRGRPYCSAVCSQMGRRKHYDSLKEKPIVKIKKKRNKPDVYLISVRLSKDIIQKIDDAAVKEERSRNYMIMKAVKEFYLA